MDTRVEQVIAVMEARLHEEIELEGLAEGVGLSLSRLARLFRRDTRMTPTEYLRHVRMTRARLLLERTSLSVGDIMTQVGIKDPSHFARDFRRAHGFSPRTLRQQLRIAGPPQRYMAVRPARG